MTTNWDDYRYFLAVAEEGSVSGAARKLDTTQPTVGRRIAELEKRLNAKLFQRSRNGYLLTELGELVRDRVKVISGESQWIERKVSYIDKSPIGRVVLSTTEDIGYFWLSNLLGNFHAEHPEIDLDLIIGYHAVDIINGEADIALRVGDPRSQDLVGRCLGQVHFGLYASPEYLARHSEPKSIEDLSNHNIIESVRQMNNFPQTAWLRQNSDGARVSFTCDNIMVELAAVEAGLGIVALPVYMISSNANVKQILKDDFDLALDLWLLTHRDLTKIPRIRAVLDFLSEHVHDRLIPKSG